MYPPIMLNAATDGRAWQEHEVKLSKILQRNEKTPKGSQVLWEYIHLKLFFKVIKRNEKYEWIKIIS